MKKGLILLTIVVLAVAISSVVYAEEYRLPVFETSDVHGYIANKSDDGYEYLLSYISDKVKDVRGYGDAYNKDLALLLDGGDIFQGNTMSNLLAGASISAAFELMDYDAVTVGNHEFDWGIGNTIDSNGTMTDSLIEDFGYINDIPALACNLFHNGEKFSWTDDYLIVTKTALNDSGQEISVRIAIIGYLDDYASEIMYSKFTGADFSILEDPNIPNLLAKHLEETNQCDLTILLCHDDAEATAKTLGKDSAIDVVLGGHTHKNKCGVTSSGIVYMEPSNHAQSFCYLELIFDEDNLGNIIFSGINNMKVISVADNREKTFNIPENEEELDPLVTKLTSSVIDIMQDVLEEEIGYITVEASKKGFIEGSGGFSTSGGNWMSSIYLRATNSDVAFTNQGGVRFSFKLSEGSDIRYVTLGEIYSNYPFDNRLYKYEITYEELLELLNYAVADSEQRLISSLIGIDCYYENNEVNALVKDGSAIYLNGQWQDGFQNKTLTIVTNEYIATEIELHNGIQNPLLNWNETSRLIDNEMIDSEVAPKVLQEEASSNDGFLFVDIEPHFIKGFYNN